MVEHDTDEFLRSVVGIELVIAANEGVETFSLGVISIRQVCDVSDTRFYSLHVDRNEHYTYPFTVFLDTSGLLPTNYRDTPKIDSFEIPEIHPSDKLYQSDMPKEIGKILECIDNISQLEPDLDDYGTLPPNDECLLNAKHIVTNLITEIYLSGLKWIEPYISSDEIGRIILEWYNNNNRQLHVIIDSDDAEYITFCKINNHPEMRDGNFNINNYILHWKWLVNE